MCIYFFQEVLNLLSAVALACSSIMFLYRLLSIVALKILFIVFVTELFIYFYFNTFNKNYCKATSTLLYFLCD